MQLPWLFSSATIGVMGFLIAGTTHENIADKVSNANPGTVEISYYQPNPTIGKVVSFGCLIAMAGCLYKGLASDTELSKPSEAEQRQILQKSETVQQSAPLPALPLRTVKIENQSSYDDPEIETDIEIKSQSQPLTSKSVSTELNHLDLIANCDGKKRHLFVACQTQTGKTTTILSAIKRKNELSQGAADWTIFDPKNSVWMGLEDQGKVVSMDYNVPSDVLKMEEKLKWAIAKMTARQKVRNEKQSKGEKYNPKPHILVFDEWVSTKKLANWYDDSRTPEQKKTTTSTWTSISRMFELLVLNGLEDGMIVWLVTQMPNCEQNGIDSGLRDQFAYWCQGRDGDFRSIEAALGNNWIVTGKKTRDGLFDRLEKARTTGSGLPLVYTNIGGHKIFEMPSINDIRSKRIFAEKTNESKVVEFRKPGGIEQNNLLEDPWLDYDKEQVN